MRIRHLLIIFLATTFALAGCGGTDVKESKGDTKAATVKTEKLSDGDVEKYFEALNSYDSDKIDQVAAATAPASIAFAYAKYISNTANANVDGGVPNESGTMTMVNDGYKLCDSGEEGDSCATFSDIESTGGKLAKFTVNGANLTDRISVGDGSPVKAGELGSVEFLGAYQTVTTAGMAINLKVSAGKAKINIDSSQATYRGPDKRQSTASQTAGPSELGADSVAFVVVFFPNAKPGGSLTMSLSSLDYMTERSVTIKTR